MEDRSRVVGGSDIGAIVGAEGAFQTPLGVYLEKIGEQPEKQEDGRVKVLRRGQRMEPVILDMLLEEQPEMRLLCRRQRYHDPSGRFTAEIDAEVEWRGERTNVEIKSSSPFAARHQGWGLGEGEDDRYPPTYAAQVQWGLGLTGRRAAILAVLIGSDDLRTYFIERDDVVVGWLQREAREFLKRVELRRPPDPTRLSELKARCSRLLGVPVDLDEPAVVALDEVFRLRAEIREREKALTAAEFTLFDFVRRAWQVPADPAAPMPSDNAVLRYLGKPLAVWRRQTREDVDAKRLREEEPMTFHKFRRETAFRVLARPPKG